MRDAAIVILALIVTASAASGDPDNLEGGVFIAHYVPELEYSQPPDDACGDYELYAIHDPGDQCNRIDSDGTYSVWFVLAAWYEDKDFRSVQFGFGGYDPAAYYIEGYGPCAPGGFLELPGVGWPGPFSGTAITCTDVVIWTGNYVPVYYFFGYAYSDPEVIPLAIDYSAGVPFGGFANNATPAEAWPAVCFGAMGLNEDGWACVPDQPGPPPEAACCVGQTCTVMNQFDCLLAGGEWLPEVPTCDPNPCTGVEYACCVGDVCQILTAAACDAAGGEWREQVTSCDPNPCVPQTYVVNPDGSGDFPNIQAAIYASVDGGVVQLTDGVFVGVGNYNVRYLGKAITVESQSGNPASCIIDCEAGPQNPRRGFLFDSDEDPDAILSGVTITGGYTYELGLGGAILCEYSSPTIRHCCFTGNGAGGGGAIGTRYSGTPTIEGCVFSHNTASESGGAVATFWTSPRVQSCTFYANTAPEGCGVYASDGASVEIANTIFAFGIMGSAISCSGGAPVVLTCCDVFGNEGGDWVGCIASQAGINGNISLDPQFCDPSGGDLQIQACSPCAPFSQPNPECDLIGALPVGCAGTPVVETSWGVIKSLYRK